MRTYWLFLLLVLNQSILANTYSINKEDFKKNHLRFHKEHIEFIKLQEGFIERQFEHLTTDLVESKKNRLPLYSWKLLQEYINELTMKSEVYQKNCILTEKTTDAIAGMKNAITKIIDEVSLNKYEIGITITENKYGKASELIEKLRSSVSMAITDLLTEAEYYSNLSSSKMNSSLYKTMHLEFHQQQIDFMTQQKKLLDECFIKLYKDNESKIDKTTLLFDWESLIDVRNEFYWKTDIYTSDCMYDDILSSCITSMRISNLYIYNKVLPDKADIEWSIENKQYTETQNMVNGIETMINKEMGDLLISANEYLQKIQ